MIKILAENVKVNKCFNAFNLNPSYGDKYFLSVKNEGNDEPEQGPRHGLGQLGGVCPHVADHEVEGEDVVSYAVAAVQQDAVHPGVKEGLTFPKLLDINHGVKDGEENEGEAGGHKDK